MPASCFGMNFEYYAHKWVRKCLCLKNKFSYQPTWKNTQLYSFTNTNIISGEDRPVFCCIKPGGLKGLRKYCNVFFITCSIKEKYQAKLW